MMEKSHSRERHCHTVFVAAIDNDIITYRAARLRNIAYTALFRAFNVIIKREEGIRAECNSCDLIEIGSLLILCIGLGAFGKVLLPNTIGANILLVLIDVSVDDVITVGSAELGLKGQIQNLIALSQEPCVCLSTGKTCAVNT